MHNDERYQKSEHQMKILLEIRNLETAGAQNIVLKQAEGLKKKGYKVVVVALENVEDSYIEKCLLDEGIKVVVNKRHRSIYKVIDKINQVRFLCSVLQNEKPDIVHANLDYIVLPVASLRYKIKFVETIHSQSYRIDTFLFRLLLRMLKNRNLVKFILQTKKLKQSLLKGLILIKI